MNWQSETAVLWLPKNSTVYPPDFPTRALPGSNDFFYYTLDAFSSIFERRNSEVEREPWAYVLETQLLLSPTQIDALKADWETEMRLAKQATTLSA
ncbi:MAG TPA: hypothetical protein VL147_12490 [Devosia sp.]|nr:hypothetical protein [Devosia sp.]